MIADMFERANSGELKAMYILGENPVLATLQPYSFGPG